METPQQKITNKIQNNLVNRQSELIAAYRKFIWEIYVDVIALDGSKKILTKINDFMADSAAWQTFEQNIKPQQ